MRGVSNPAQADNGADVENTMSRNRNSRRSAVGGILWAARSSKLFYSDELRYHPVYDTRNSLNLHEKQTTSRPHWQRVRNCIRR